MNYFGLGDSFAEQYAVHHYYFGDVFDKVNLKKYIYRKWRAVNLQVGYWLFRFAEGEKVNSF